MRLRRARKKNGAQLQSLEYTDTRVPSLLVLKTTRRSDETINLTRYQNLRPILGFDGHV
jgi:hypothetical protein